MRAILQRVSSANVVIDQQIKAQIGVGIMILVGIEDNDDDTDIHWLVNKITSLRIFSDDEGKMNLSIKEVNGDFLVISQFTLHASTKKGNRPSYIKAARPEKAIPLYESFLKNLEDIHGKEIFSGIFGADMKVQLINDGPVTIFIDSKNKE